MNIVNLFKNGVEEVVIRSSKPIDAGELIQKEFDKYDYWYYNYAEEFLDGKIDNELNALFQVMIEEINPRGPYCNVYQVDPYTVSFANEVREVIKTCVICEEELKGDGNNPEPIKDDDEGQCCDSCNFNYVIPKRMEGLLQ